MTDILRIRWQISPSAVSNAVADETVVLHLGSNGYFSLDAIGARVWGAIAAGLPPIAVFDGLMTEFGVERATLEADLCDLVADLLKKDLIAPT